MPAGRVPAPPPGAPQRPGGPPAGASVTQRAATPRPRAHRQWRRAATADDRSWAASPPRHPPSRPAARDGGPPRRWPLPDAASRAAPARCGRHRRARGRRSLRRARARRPRRPTAVSPGASSHRSSSLRSRGLRAGADAHAQSTGQSDGFVLPGMRQRSERTGALPRRVRSFVYLPIFPAFVTRISIVAFGRYVRLSAADADQLRGHRLALERAALPAAADPDARAARGPDRHARERGARCP